MFQIDFSCCFVVVVVALFCFVLVLLIAFLLSWWFFLRVMSFLIIAIVRVFEDDSTLSAYPKLERVKHLFVNVN